MQNENDFKRLAVMVSPDVIDRCKKDITSKSDDPIEDYALNNLIVKCLCGRLAEDIYEKLRDEERSTFDISKREAISEANPVGLMEAIQILGPPLEMRITRPALVPNPVREDSFKGLTSGAVCTTPYGTMRADIFDVGRPYENTLQRTRISFSYPAEYVDFTFRLPLTDELRAYLPEIKDRYETVKRVRDCMYNGKNPLDEE